MATLEKHPRGWALRFKTHTIPQLTPSFCPLAAHQDASYQFLLHSMLAYWAAATHPAVMVLDSPLDTVSTQ